MRNTVVVDSNVILRYLLADHEEQFVAAKAFFEKVRDGQTTAYVSEAVIAECVYVLLKVYGVPRRELAESLLSVVSMRGCTAPNGPALLVALRDFADREIDFVDALVLAIAQTRGCTTYSFNADVPSS